jgi:hypothetical protein
MASKRQLELMDQLGKLDAYLSDARARLDAQARGRLFSDMVEVAGQLVKHAKAAAACQQELDKILTAEWEQRRR